VFYALALNEAVDLADKSYSRQLKAAAILERLALTLPDHPGIPHLLIHSYDYAPIAARGLPAARRGKKRFKPTSRPMRLPKPYAAAVNPGSVVNPAASGHP
jgi:hypothetical protein